jgi:hypothetical protein
MFVKRFVSMQRVFPLRDGSGGNYSAQFDRAIQRIIAMRDYPDCLRITSTQIASLVQYGHWKYSGKPYPHGHFIKKGKFCIAMAVCNQIINFENGTSYLVIRNEDPVIGERSATFEKVSNGVKVNGSD